MKRTLVVSEGQGGSLLVIGSRRRKPKPQEDALAELRRLQMRSQAQDAVLAELNATLETEKARLRQLGFVVDEGGQGYMDLPIPYWQAS